MHELAAQIVNELTRGLGHRLETVQQDYIITQNSFGSSNANSAIYKCTTRCKQNQVNMHLKNSFRKLKNRILHAVKQIIQVKVFRATC